MQFPFQIIPLESSRSNSWMCWVNGVSIFLALFFVSSALIFQHTIKEWRTQAQHGFSVNLPPAEGKPTASDHKNLNKVLELLRKNPAIRNYNILSKSTIHATTDLKYNDHLANSPTPIVIDVETHPTMSVDYEGISVAINKIYPGAEVSHDREWQEGLLKLAGAVYSLGIFLTTIVCLITLSIISFSTYTSLMIHLNIVRALIQMGATRYFIANRFQLHALTTTGISSLVGIGFGLLAIIVCLALSIQGESLPQLAIPYGSIIASIFGIPLFLMVLTIITAQATVYIALYRLRLC